MTQDEIEAQKVTLAFVEAIRPAINDVLTHHRRE